MQKQLIVRVLLPVALFALLCAGAVWFAWRQGAFLPGWIQWQEEKDLRTERDGLQVSLSRRQAEVFEGETLLWKTEPEWKIQDVLLCDIDHDGQEELLLLCWKVGRFGEKRPFWIKKDEKKWSQHIFIYDVEDREVKAKWMSSYLPTDVAEWRFDTEKRLILKDPKGEETSWDWISWGLESIE